MALRTHAAMSAASLLLVGVGASLLLVQPNGYSNAAALRKAPPPKPPAVEAAVEHRKRIQHHDFGKLVIRGDTVLEHEFAFVNESPDPIELKNVVGQPSCCVKATTSANTVGPYAAFKVKLAIKPSPQPGRHLWRGIAQSTAGPPFFVEAVAELVPTLNLVWNAQVRPEFEVGETATRAGTLQFVGKRKPEHSVLLSADSNVIWTLGEWDDRGKIDGLSEHLYETPINASCKTPKPGSHSALCNINIDAGKEQLVASFDWTVRSDWILDPKVLTLSPNNRNGTATVRSRSNRTSRAPPKIEMPIGLSVESQPSADGWKLRIAAVQESKQTLQTINLDIDGETVSLSVIHVLKRESQGDEP